MKRASIFIFLGVLFLCYTCENPGETIYIKDPVRLSEDFLLAIKTEQSYQPFRDSLAIADLQELELQLNSSEKRLAFWINTYNALVQSKIRDDVEAFEEKDWFFKEKDQLIGRLHMSLDNIETGILRKKTTDLNKNFLSKFQVDKLDPRIHFTLNCGATSCPPVAYYSPEKLDEQLDLATESFITQTSSFNKNDNSLVVSQLFEWYEEDFGGYEGILELHRRFNIIAPEDKPVLFYTPYNWQVDANNFE